MNMSQSIEVRVSKIEDELNQIRDCLAQTQSPANWIKKTAGAFRGDTDYAEIARLGKEIRDLEQPELEQ
jgi:hypothetical protein